MEKVRNFRDLSEASIGLQKGLIYRSANPAEANSSDVKNLRNDLGLKWVVDLRSPDEVAEDGEPELFHGCERWEHVRNGFSTGNKFSVQKTTSTVSSQYAPMVVHHMTLLEKRRYYFALMLKLNICTALTVVLLGIVLPDYSRQLVIQEVNKGGLLMLYEIILDTAIPEIGQVMQVIFNAVRDKQPILFNCKAGKDRTGLVAMLVLSCAGVTDEEIVADYIKSDREGGQVALGGLEKQKELQGLDYSAFSCAPAAAMTHALYYLRRKYGSVSNYLVKAGFDRQKQIELGKRLKGEEI